MSVPGRAPGRGGTTRPSAGRPRDAASTREALLTAAGELFAARGFEGTTTRDVGARAGVDPALIARYFGGKTQLYVATLLAERGEEPPADLLSPERLRELLERADRPGGPGPVFGAAVRPQGDPAAQAAAQAALQARLVVPLRDRLARHGVADAALRAEVAAAAVVGVLLARGAGALGVLASAGRDDVATVLGELLAALAPAAGPHDTEPCNPRAGRRSSGERTTDREVPR